MRLLIAAAALAFAAPAEAADSPYTAIFSFGDSLSDAGNLYLATPITIPNPPPAPPTVIPNQPVPPYYQNLFPLPPPFPPVSAGVFSNGPVWTQDLSQALGLGRLYPSLLGGTDYAFGGATTGTTDINSATLIDLPAQVDAFLNTYPGDAPSSALYTVWIGANDVLLTLEARAAQAITEQEAQTVVSEAAQNEVTEIEALVSDGAKDLLVFDLPNLGMTPRYNMSSQKGEASALSLLYNHDLSADLSPITGATIDQANPYYIFDYIVNNGAKYGFMDTTDACFTGTYDGGPSSGSECVSPNQYLFWDSLHPTEPGQEFLTDLALSTLGVATPEPSTWAMMAIGFAGLAALGARKVCAAATAS